MSGDHHRVPGSARDGTGAHGERRTAAVVRLDQRGRTCTGPTRHPIIGRRPGGRGRPRDRHRAAVRVGSEFVQLVRRDSYGVFVRGPDVGPSGEPSSAFTNCDDNIAATDGNHLSEIVCWGSDDHDAADQNTKSKHQGGRGKGPGGRGKGPGGEGQKAPARRAPQPSGLTSCQGPRGEGTSPLTSATAIGGQPRRHRSGTMLGVWRTVTIAIGLLSTGSFLVGCAGRSATTSHPTVADQSTTTGPPVSGGTTPALGSATTSQIRGVSDSESDDAGRVATARARGELVGM